jgi:hypothetical protein
MIAPMRDDGAAAIQRGDLMLVKPGHRPTGEASDGRLSGPCLMFVQGIRHDAICRGAVRANASEPSPVPSPSGVLTRSVGDGPVVIEVIQNPPSPSTPVPAAHGSVTTTRLLK